MVGVGGGAGVGSKIAVTVGGRLVTVHTALTLVTLVHVGVAIPVDVGLGVAIGVGVTMARDVVGMGVGVAGQDTHNVWSTIVVNTVTLSALPDRDGVTVAMSALEVESAESAPGEVEVEVGEMSSLATVLLMRHNTSGSMSSYPDPTSSVGVAHPSGHTPWRQLAQALTAEQNSVALLREADISADDGLPRHSEEVRFTQTTPPSGVDTVFADLVLGGDVRKV